MKKLSFCDILNGGIDDCDKDFPAFKKMWKGSQCDIHGSTVRITSIREVVVTMEQVENKKEMAPTGEIPGMKTYGVLLTVIAISCVLAGFALAFGVAW